MKVQVSGEAQRGPGRPSNQALDDSFDDPIARA